MRVYALVCVCVCMCVYIYIYIYIYIYTFSCILTMHVILGSFQQFSENSFLQFQGQSVHNLHFYLTMKLKSLQFLKMLVTVASRQS